MGGDGSGCVVRTVIAVMVVMALIAVMIVKAKLVKVVPAQVVKVGTAVVEVFWCFEL